MLGTITKLKKGERGGGGSDGNVNRKRVEPGKKIISRQLALT